MALNNEEERCIECGGKLVNTGTDMVCSRCGLVNSRIYQDPAYQSVKTAKSYGSVYTSVGDITVDGERLGSCLGGYGRWHLSDHNGTSIKSKLKHTMECEIQTSW